MQVRLFGDVGTEGRVRPVSIKKEMKKLQAKHYKYNVNYKIIKCILKIGKTDPL